MENIKYPEKDFEIDTQTHLLILLREMGYDAKQEVKFKNNRFDIVIFEEKKAICIIEVKNHKRKYIGSPALPSLQTKQLTKYKKMGLPVLLCRNANDMPRIIERVKKLKDTFPI